jgi:putative transposase
LKDMMGRRLDKTWLCALLIDATPFAGQQMVAALGIDEYGRKMILGIRQGATENATVVGALLGEPVERGFDFTEPRHYILDGAKALSAAVKKHPGESAAIQRSQVHKRRNVPDHLTDEQKPGVAKKLNAAYALEDYAAAKQALNVVHRELMDLNPSAARTLGEGLEEMLTVHRLHLPKQLRKTMASTNVIESAFSIVEHVCRNVKRWHGGDQRERWVGSGLMVAEKQFRRITGYKLIPVLIKELETLTPSKAPKHLLSNGQRRRKVGYAGVATFNGVPDIPPIVLSAAAKAGARQGTDEQSNHETARAQFTPHFLLPYRASLLPVRDPHPAAVTD